MLIFSKCWFLAIVCFEQFCDIFVELNSTVQLFGTAHLYSMDHTGESHRRE